MKIEGAIAIIPARMASSRLPGKPLADICGKPMVQWVYEHAAVALGRALVATSDPEIVAAVEAFGGRAVLTGEHPNGTSRVAEACRLAGVADGDVVVNVQGDEPLLLPSDIHRVAELVAAGADIATLRHACIDASCLTDRHQVKVRVAADGRALEFGRIMPESVDCHMHIGVYAFRADVLQRVAALEPSAGSVAQSLEQVTWLDAGYTIATAEAESATVGVDTQEDLERVRQVISNSE